MLRAGYPLSSRLPERPKAARGPKRASDFVRAAGASALLLEGLEQLTEGVVLFECPAENPNARVLYVNAAFAAAFARPIEQLVDGPLEALFPDEEELGSVHRAVARGKAFRRELRLPTSSAGQGCWSLSLQPVRHPPAGREHWMGVLRDESSERRNLQTIIDREKLLAAELLAAGMAHEINNPLTTVTTSLEWLAATLPALVVTEVKAQTPRPSAIGPISAALVDALAGAERIEATIRYLSMLSGLQDPHRELLDVRLVLESALTELEGQLEGDIAMVRNYSHVAPVLASEQRLKQVFVNLLVNAAQAIGKDSASRCITLSTLGQSRVRVEIQDSGSGVAEVVRDRLFAPFVTTKALGVGKGLSLFVCKTILESAGGAVGFRTTPGHGSTFWVELPAALPSSPP